MSPHTRSFSPKPDKVSELFEHPPYAPPGLECWLGVDALGRSFLPRLIAGSFTTALEIAFAATLALLIGLVFGGIGASGKGLAGRLVFRTGSMLSFSTPLIAVLLLLYSFAGDRRGIFPLSAGILLWGPAAMTFQTVIARERSSDYMKMAKALGIPPLQRTLFYLLPNLGPAAAQAWLANWPVMLTAHLIAAYLGATGGSTLGSLLKSGYDIYPSAWWLWLPPTLVSAGLYALVQIMLANRSSQRLKGPD